MSGQKWEMIFSQQFLIFSHEKCRYISYSDDFYIYSDTLRVEISKIVVEISLTLHLGSSYIHMY